MRLSYPLAMVASEYMSLAQQQNRQMCMRLFICRLQPGDAFQCWHNQLCLEMSSLPGVLAEAWWDWQQPL